ncbi:uncharacterized protein LOC105280628 [Ooceraea biroi]|uniref:uncharacterized protein LOC105280628 n=1 Tax=Ooceraea biroi TaxID=2015173 RepID=UPI000F09A156|nr:uncharacterized protein LOC105280628 [Ooceraea biroi]
MFVTPGCVYLPRTAYTCIYVSVAAAITPYQLAQRVNRARRRRMQAKNRRLREIIPSFARSAIAAAQSAIDARRDAVVSRTNVAVDAEVVAVGRRNAANRAEDARRLAVQAEQTLTRYVNVMEQATTNMREMGSRGLSLALAANEARRYAEGEAQQDESEDTSAIDDEVDDFDAFGD